MEGTESSDYEADAKDVAIRSSINAAISEYKKSGVVIFIIPGETSIYYDVPQMSYDSDNLLHQWVKEALDTHVLLLNTSDEKISKVIEVCNMLHFDCYAVLDYPDQGVTGTAYSLVSSLNRVLHSELEMFGNVKERDDQSTNDEVVNVDPTEGSGTQQSEEGQAGAQQAFQRTLRKKT